MSKITQRIKDRQEMVRRKNLEEIKYRAAIEDVLRKDEVNRHMRAERESLLKTTEPTIFDTIYPPLAISAVIALIASYLMR